MLRRYCHQAGHLVEGSEQQPNDERSFVWLDLLNPTPGETEQVEQQLGIDLPSRDEMAEIELSARLYQEAGAEFMTLTALAKLESDEPVKTPVTFVLKGDILVTIRHVDPKPFEAYTQRATKPNGSIPLSGEHVMLGIIEALIDRTADVLERIGDDVDAISREVFRHKTGSAKKLTRDLQSTITQIGRKGELLAMIQESLVSTSRLVAYHAALDIRPVKAARETRQLMKVIQRDAISLGEHARALSNRIGFVLDAVMGMINLEQNQIIKIFSVVAVIFLPPTLVASAYGMNFDFMPELHWHLGYPFAIGLMLLSAILPYVLFKLRGWL
jgi:magnesium transporter